MDDGLNTAFSSLQDQTSKINIALYYCGGDMERAKQMAAGSYKDMYAIKARFVSSSLNGGFIIFFNSIYNKFVSSLVAVMPSYINKTLETSVDWRIFEKDIAEVLSGNERDDHLGSLLKNRIYDSFNFTFAIELSRLLESKNTIAIERVFQKLIQFILNLQRIDIKVDYQQISSLDMELLSTSSPKIDLSALAKAAGQEQPQAEEKQQEPVRPGMEGVKLVLQASLILSPIKGKDISKLQPGDRVKVTIVDKNPKAVSVGQALEAYKDGAFSPVTARIKIVEYSQETGYTFYAVIAKGIYVKIVEEESNIKVAMDATYELARQDSGEDASVNIPLMLILVVAFILAVALVLYLVL